MMTPEETRALVKASKKRMKAIDRRLRAYRLRRFWEDNITPRTRALGSGLERIFDLWAKHWFAIGVTLLLLCFVPGVAPLAGVLLGLHFLIPAITMVLLILFGPLFATGALFLMVLFSIVALVRFILVDMLGLF